MAKDSNRNRKFKYISIRLFRDEEYLSTDILYFHYHPTVDSLNVYEVLTFNGQKIVYNKICERFTKRKPPLESNEIKNKMRELIRKEPTLSAAKS